MADTRYWLMKTEPDDYSIDDLRRDGTVSWDGVRNYQARNYMRDDMKTGDLVLFYHSNAEPSGVAGIAKVCRTAHPDVTALDRKNKHYDPKATAENSIWMMVDLGFVEKFDRVISLKELRATPGLEKLPVLQRGQRLSVMPISQAHFEIIKQLALSQ